MGAKSTPQPTSLKLGIDETLADRALRALLKHHESSADKEQLLGNDLDVQVQFTLARIPGNASPKPIRIEVPHPLVKVDGGDSMEDDADDYLQGAEVCLIVKEESKPWVQEMIARFPSQLGCIKKVLGLQSLRTKHKDFAQKRALLARFDVFLADDRILPMLTKALGGKFFNKKKQPVPIKLTRKEALPFAVQKCLRSTFMHLSAGTCLTVKAGSTAMPSAKLIANIQSICAAVPTKVPRKWSNVRSISIKTTASVALPIYNKTPEELEEIMKLAKEEGKEAAKEEKANEDVGKKRKLVASTPLAKALKKQKAAEKVEAKEVEVPVKSAKKSSKKKKRKESVDETEEEVAVKVTKTPKSSKKKIIESVDEVKEEEEKKEPTKTPKSSKKKKKETAAVVEQEEEVTSKKAAKTPKSSKKKSESVEEEEVVKVVKTPKSSKKRKNKTEDTESVASSKKSPAKEETFISARKFEGAKKGYVFKKDKLGKGYYKDVVPVVDLVWRDSLGKSGGRGVKKGPATAIKKRKKGGKSGRRSF